MSAILTPSKLSGSVLPWLAPTLADALRNQRGHALLVHGPEGAGQFDFALALARAWLCETPVSGRSGGLACGQCESCHLVTSEQVHPDLCVLLPEALHRTLGWRHEPAPAESPDKKPSLWISIDQVRSATLFSSLTRARGRLKVVLIHPAERMQDVAASALLKLLEEPSGNQRLVLSCADAHALLPTVRSRCHAVALPLPDARVAADWLQAQGLSDAALLLAAHGGSPLAALERQASGLDATVWKRLPASVVAGDCSGLAKCALPLAIECLQKLCHDALLVACGAPARYFPGASVPTGADIGALTRWGQELRRVARHAEHPWNASLMLESLVQQGQRALTGG